MNNQTLSMAIILAFPVLGCYGGYQLLHRYGRRIHVPPPVVSCVMAIAPADRRTHASGAVLYRSGHVRGLPTMIPRVGQFRDPFRR